jgi:hypothetical protein
VALNRLHTEQEVVVCFAGGMSRWRVISPAMRLACTIAFLALVTNLFVSPAAYRALRQELFEVRTDLAATLVREGEFSEPAPGPDGLRAERRPGRATCAISSSTRSSPTVRTRPTRPRKATSVTPRRGRCW